MNDCCDPKDSKLIKRARDNIGYPEAWEGKQILRCRECQEAFIV